MVFLGPNDGHLPKAPDRPLLDRLLEVSSIKNGSIYTSFMPLQRYPVMHSAAVTFSSHVGLIVIVTVTVIVCYVLLLVFLLLLQVSLS